jgi:hypothetical protein
MTVVSSRSTCSSFRNRLARDVPARLISQTVFRDEGAAAARLISHAEYRHDGVTKARQSHPNVIAAATI